MNLEQEQKLERYLNFLTQDPDNINLIVDIIRLHIENQAYEQARHYVQRLEGINPQLALVPQATIDLHEKKYEAAAQGFRLALEQEDNLYIRYSLSLCCFHLQTLDEALSLLQPLLKDNDPKALLLAARILYQEKKPDDALNDLNKALSQHPQYAEALAFKALICFDQSHTEEAKKLYQQALHLNPRLYEAQLLDVLLSEDISPEQIKRIDALLELQPLETRLWFMRGYTFLTQFDIDQAEASFSKAIAIFPDYYDAYISLSWCQLFKDQKEEAQYSCQQASEILPESGEAWGGMALIHALNGQVEKAIPLLEKSRQLEPDNFMGKIADIMILNEKNPEQAKAQFDKVFQQDMNVIRHLFETHLFSHAPNSDALH